MGCPRMFNPTELGARQRRGQCLAGKKPCIQCFMGARYKFAADESAVKDNAVEMLVEFLFEKVADIVHRDDSFRSYAETGFLEYLFDGDLRGCVANICPTRRKEPKVTGRSINK